MLSHNTGDGAGVAMLVGEFIGRLNATLYSSIREAEMLRGQTEDELPGFNSSHTNGKWSINYS